MAVVSYLVHYNTLLQIATDIITKCDKNILQHASPFLFQNATMLLQSATFITKCVSTVFIKVNEQYLRVR